MTSKVDRGPSNLQRVQELRGTYGLLVPSDARCVQRVVKDSLAAFASAADDEASLSDGNESYEAEKADVEKSLAAFEDNSAVAEFRIQESEHNKDKLDDLATMAKETETKLKSCEE